MYILAYNLSCCCGTRVKNLRKQQQDKRADAEADPPSKRGGRLAGSFTQ